ncbi:hypothetical protein D9M69_702510 [compost metagenome]
MLSPTQTLFDLGCAPRCRNFDPEVRATRVGPVIQALKQIDDQSLAPLDLRRLLLQKRLRSAILDPEARDL